MTPEEYLQLKSMPVHPYAAMFPMMSEDELNDLATDIRENGLLSPIVLDAAGAQIVDGRNRLEACARAGVTPRFVRLEDEQDPVAFILGSNVRRRHLNKGQEAMASVAALLFNNNGPTQEQLEAQLEISQAYIAQANVVLSYARDLAERVMAGIMNLNAAYLEVRKRKEAAQSDEAKFARLQQRYPELAVKVQEGELTLTGAWAEADARDDLRRREEQAERDQIALRTKRFDSFLTDARPGSGEHRGDEGEHAGDGSVAPRVRGRRKPDAQRLAARIRPLGLRL